MSDPRPSVRSLYACLYRPRPLAVSPAVPSDRTLAEIADVFSPRYELQGDDLVTIDVSGLERLLGSPRTIGEELRRELRCEAAGHGGRANVAVAHTRMTAMVLAFTRPGLTVIDAGDEAVALASIPVGILETLHADHVPPAAPPAAREVDVRAEPAAVASAKRSSDSAISAVTAVKHWGIRTLGELAALPPAELSARLGLRGLAWQSIARGEDTRPLVPTRPEERFDASLELEWPIEGLEPLSFVLTRLLEPLSTRLERRDRGVAVLHIALRLVTRDIHASRLELPSPMREVRALRTLALLDFEAHPPAAAIDQVTITIEPTPGRILQHTLFTRPHPTPEQLSTLLARLNALMGQERVGRPVTVDSYRPGAFAMQPFAIDRSQTPPSARVRSSSRPGPAIAQPQNPQLLSALRRCRQPVPARVLVGDDRRPVRVTTDRQGFTGGPVTSCAGPWRTSGEWWKETKAGWDRDEWDVALGDGAVYRIFRDHPTNAWFIDGIVD